MLSKAIGSVTTPYAVNPELVSIEKKQNGGKVDPSKMLAPLLSTIVTSCWQISAKVAGDDMSEATVIERLWHVSVVAGVERLPRARVSQRYPGP